jgi:hypothetical protein
MRLHCYKNYLKRSCPLEKCRPGNEKAPCWCRNILPLADSGGQNDDFRPLTYTLGGRGMGCRDKYVTSCMRLQLAMNRFLHLWPHRFPHFGYILRPICKCRCPPLLADTDILHSSMLGISSGIWSRTFSVLLMENSVRASN